MFTKQQQHQLAEFLISYRAPLALIEPLATPSVLCIADADGKRALHWAVKHHNDPEVIALVISRHPPALVAVVGGEHVVTFFRDLPVENRFSNHDEVGQLLCDCYHAFKEHHFPRLIELCGTSDALEALDAAYVEDDLSLYVLCCRKSWDKVLARIKKLPTQAAIDELFSQDELGCTVLARASIHKAPVEVLESMLAKLDASKRNILVIADIDLCLPLHTIAQYHLDPAAIKLLVSHHPPALLAKTEVDQTPQDCAIEHNESPAVVALLHELTPSYEIRDYPALITFCDPSPVLIHLHSLSLRSAAMLCLERIKTTPVPPPACPTTVTAIYLLSEIYDHEKGIVREIFSYLG